MSRRSADRDRTWTFDLNMSWNYSFARMSEWSKEPDLRPGANSAWVRTPLRACLVCRRLVCRWLFCLPTAERCLSVGDFFIKIYIFFFDIYFSNTYVCRRLSVALYKHSTAFYSWYHIFLYYYSVERFQLNTQLTTQLTTQLNTQFLYWLMSAYGWERCSMNYTITVLFYILDTIYSSIITQ